MLLLSEASVWVFSIGGRNLVHLYMRHPAMATHTCSFLYYCFELFLSKRSLLDVFGRPIYPLRCKPKLRRRPGMPRT